MKKGDICYDEIRLHMCVYVRLIMNKKQSVGSVPCVVGFIFANDSNALIATLIVRRFYHGMTMISTINRNCVHRKFARFVLDTHTQLLFTK